MTTTAAGTKAGVWATFRDSPLAAKTVTPAATVYCSAWSIAAIQRGL